MSSISCAEDKELLLHIYYVMNKIRDFENEALELYHADKLYGGLHTYVGEEAVAATAAALLTDQDYTTGTHRGHGCCIAKGVDLKEMMAEIMGKETGACKGRGGSMHISDLNRGNLGANGIVGAGLPIAVGGGLTIKVQGRKNVSVCFFGDGASNQGTFHESANLASVWKLPVIFVCENNGYAVSTPTSLVTSVEDIAQRGRGYNMPAEIVDGNDVIAMLDVFERAYARARAGEGPSLIECKTYRWHGHWTGDSESYRTKEEVEEWKKKCPIKRLKAYLLEKGIADEAETDAMEQKALEEVKEAVSFAENSPEPDPAAVTDYVYF